MTEKRCTDCKYTRGIGYDFWCGEGHTEYEVFGAKTNCPYYEYHDWSKGTPSRTEKRYGFEMDSKCYMCICDTIDKKLYTDKKQVVDLLNDLHEENEQLKSELKTIQNTFEVSWTQDYTEFDKDELFIKDTHTRLHLKNNNLFIQVFIPSINEYYYFKYRVTGRSLMREFIENYNLKEDLK